MPAVCGNFFPVKSLLPGILLFLLLPCVSPLPVLAETPPWLVGSFTSAYRAENLFSTLALSTELPLGIRRVESSAATSARRAGNAMTRLAAYRETEN